jgi:hypothetical protein
LLMGEVCPTPVSPVTKPENRRMGLAGFPRSGKALNRWFHPSSAEQEPDPVNAAPGRGWNAGQKG